MASLQRRNDTWNCIFRFQGKRHWMNLGQVEPAEARAVTAKVDYFLLRLKQRLLELPPGCDIVTFIESDGKPPSAEKVQQEERDTLTLTDIRDRYLKVHGGGSLEETTLVGIKQHFKHWVKTLGSRFLIQRLTLADLQGHVDRRAVMKGIRGLLSPATIKKEIITLRTVWNWGVQFGLVTGRFPNKGLRFPKMDQKPPFQTVAEIEHKIATSHLSKKEILQLWDAVFLTTAEVQDLLAYVKKHANQPWVYPMFCFAAHTGARRSETLRTQINDVDFASGTVVIREKKRVRGERSTRRVPLTPFLKQTLKEWLQVHPGGDDLFCQLAVVSRSKKRSPTTGHLSDGARPSTLVERLASVMRRPQQPLEPPTRSEAHSTFKHVLAGHSQWKQLRGYHVFRHSFASNCAARGIDQRILDAWLGHTTEIRKRYLHLIPNTEATAIGMVFGNV